MPEVRTEGSRAAAFILSEANGHRSRENGTVAQGENLAAGQAVMLSGANLVAQDGALDTAGDLVTPTVGLLIYNVDASATGLDADTAASFLARDAEVNGNLLTFPTETTAGGERAAVVAGLALLGIEVRDELPTV